MPLHAAPELAKHCCHALPGEVILLLLLIDRWNKKQSTAALPPFFKVRLIRVQVHVHAVAEERPHNSASQLNLIKIHIKIGAPFSAAALLYATSTLLG